MLKLMLLLHLLTAIFAIGPLAHAVTTASRGLRRSDRVALQASSRTAKVYAAASVLVVIFGMGLMSQKRRGKELGSIGDTWIWLSLLLWALSIAITFFVITPSLDKAAEALATSASSAAQPAGDATVPTVAASSYTARVAASGGVVGLIFAVIVVLMVYRPGG